MRPFRLLFLALAAFTALPASSQEISTSDMEILLDKVKADKKLLVAGNMQLTDTEAKTFWPIYESYQADLGKLNQRLGKMIEGYAKEYNAGTLSDAKAGELTEEYLAVQQAEVDLNRSYVQKLAGVIPPKKVARYLQIENKIRTLIRLDLAEGIPLVN